MILKLIYKNNNLNRAPVKSFLVVPFLLTLDCYAWAQKPDVMYKQYKPSIACNVIMILLGTTIHIVILLVKTSGEIMQLEVRNTVTGKQISVLVTQYSHREIGTRSFFICLFLFQHKKIINLLVYFKNTSLWRKQIEVTPQPLQSKY